VKALGKQLSVLYSVDEATELTGSPSAWNMVNLHAGRHAVKNAFDHTATESTHGSRDFSTVMMLLHEISGETTEWNKDKVELQ
jgi:hypothetical protein